MHKRKSLVEQLFDGEIYAAEQFNPYESKDYKKELEEVRDAEDTFTSSLPPELRRSSSGSRRRRLPSRPCSACPDTP